MDEHGKGFKTYSKRKSKSQAPVINYAIYRNNE